MYNNTFNPYQSMYDSSRLNPGVSSYYQQLNNGIGVKQEVVRVNGKNGAQAYLLQPNSSILLLDETAPIVWLKMTDGAGYPTLTAYDIIPHADEGSQIDTKCLDELRERVSKLEDIINEQFKQSNVESSQPIKRVSSTK